MAIQQLLLGAGGAAKKTYIDDIFSTYLWEGNSTENTNINNGINLSGEGGMVWIKKRSNSDDNLVYDTNRGHNERIITNSDTDNGGLGQRLTGFNANGFKLGNNTQVNASSNTYSSWTFRKAPGFFDVVTYTGNGSSDRDIPHNLGCVPGFVIVKRTVGGTGDWKCLHRYDFDKYLELNQVQTAASSSADFPSHPTSTTFTVSSDAAVNKDGDSYVAYVFAGGESTAATARSVDFDGSGNEALTIPNSSDLNISTGDWTIECWAKPDDTDDGGGVLLSTGGGTSGNYEATMFWLSDLNIEWYIANSSSSWIHTAQVATLKKGQWSHIAATREGNTFRFFLDGTLTKEFTDSATLNNVNSPFHIGGRNSGSAYNGLVSNFRLVKGTAVYTSSFRPPTEPLTNITNTKLLCCNDSSVTGSTVTPGTITSQGDAAASSDSPFDDPAAFTFGENGDQGIIKCGSYVGNGNNDGVTVELGWEPQYILVKCTDLSENWYIMDSIRGIFSAGSGEPNLIPNSDGGESTISQIDLTPTGFKCKNSDDKINGDGHHYIYVAIRRPDGYVGKPVEAGTDVFAMDSGNSSTSIPAFDSGFPVDFSIYKDIDSQADWQVGSRLQGGVYLFTSETDAEASASAWDNWDSNAGFFAASWASSDKQAWMFKRHAGFDVVGYKGNDLARKINHSMNAVPEMIWVKARGTTYDWRVYHKGLNGGTNPEQQVLVLNSNAAEVDLNTMWNDTAPTSSAFSIGTHSHVNANGEDFIAMLFASVDGISKCDFYDGQDSDLDITTGFTPRFVLAKCTNIGGSYNHWYVFDSLRGAGSGNDKELHLNADSAQTTSHDTIEITSNGFTVKVYYGLNEPSRKYIYYAHA